MTRPTHLMHIGIDFDNTIVCYDQLFHRVCLEAGLIPADVPPTKSEVRDYLRRVGREDDWTEAQGWVYGRRLVDADPYPGFDAFLGACHRVGCPVSIVSHKTRVPYRGEPVDLHQAAHTWLQQRGFLDPGGSGQLTVPVYFELAKEAKLRRIGEIGCTHFIDDLPEFLAEPGFPPGVQRVLFDPGGDAEVGAGILHVRSWEEARARLVLGS
jgi:hypothetical protein